MQSPPSRQSPFSTAVCSLLGSQALPPTGAHPFASRLPFFLNLIRLPVLSGASCLTTVLKGHFNSAAITQSSMSLKIENLGQKILQQTPTLCATSFAAISIYCSECDRQVRQDWPNDKHNLAHWAKVFGMAKKFMPAIAGLGFLTSLGAYHQTKEKLWLYGGVTLISIVPFTLLTMSKTNSYLNGVLSATEGEELDAKDRDTVLEKLKEWVNKNRVRGVLAVAAVGLFFAAKHANK